MENTKQPIVTILMPHFSPMIYTEVMAGICSIVRHPLVSARVPLILPTKQTISLAKIRNNLATLALSQSDCTHLLWLDGDQLYPSGFIEKLLSYGKDIIGTWTMNRSEEIPNCYIWNDEGKTKHIPVYPRKLTEVDRLGFGGIMVSREVFEKMGTPWFDYDDKHVTEDLYFCDKAKGLGYKIYVDGDLRSSHLDTIYR